MPSSTLPGLPTPLLAAANAATDLLYVAIDPFGPTDDRKQDRTNFFGQIPVAVGLGRPSAITGTLLFYTANNANAVTLRTDTPAAALTYVLPNASPTAGQALTASVPVANVVTLTWATISAAPGGATTQVQYNNAGAFGGITGATTNGTNTTFASTTLRATNPQITTGIQDANGNAILNFTASGGTVVNQLTLANSTATNPVVISTTGTDTNIGLTIAAKGTGITTITGNAIINAGTGATTIGEASLGAEQLRLTSISASRIALSVNSQPNATVDLITATQNRSNTNTVANLATLTTNSNGAAAAGFGHSITHQLESSTTDGQVAAVDSVYWKVATHASRASVRSLSTVSNAVTSERFIVAPRLALTDNTQTTLFTVLLPTSNTGCGGIVTASIFAVNPGNAAAQWSGSFAYSGVNSGGTIFPTAVAPAASTPSPVLNINDGGGTLTTVTFRVLATAGGILVQVNADVSFAATTFYIMFSIDNQSESAITLA